MNFKKFSVASILGCVAISFPLILAACGDDSSSSSNSNEGNGEDFAMEMEFYRAGFDVRKSLKDLDPCDDETEGAAAVVLADTSVYYCYDGKWNDKAREYILDENEPRKGMLLTNAISVRTANGFRTWVAAKLKAPASTKAPSPIPKRER